jgi:hypothetical protein
MTIQLKAAAWLAGLVLALGACGGHEPESSSAAPTATSAESTTSTTSTTSTESTTSSEGSEKVSANDASEEEIAAALEAKGVPEAERWAHEVAEYAPTPPTSRTCPSCATNWRSTTRAPAWSTRS